MYAVIFKAKTKNLDDQYSLTAIRMRERALSEYGCLNFVSNFEDGFEIAISYWSDLESIKKWKEDEAHQNAQNIGKNKWYESYEVEIVEILKQYSF